MPNRTKRLLVTRRYQSTRAGTGDLRIRATSFNSMNKKVLNYQEKNHFCHFRTRFRKYKYSDRNMAHNLKAGIMATTTMVSAFAYSKTQNGVTDDEQASRMSGVNGQSHSGYGAQEGHSF